MDFLPSISVAYCLAAGFGLISLLYCLDRKGGGK